MTCRIPFLVLSLALALSPLPLAAQAAGQSAGTGLHFQAFDFDEELGAKRANLLLAPFAYRLPLGERFSADFYGAWARGNVERDGIVYTLSGLVDTQLRAQFAPASWAVLTVAANLPTGNATHDANEAVVASVLATEMLGFREASWGTGAGITSGIATARRVGAWGIGAGVSHRLAGDFEPSADSDLVYAPGSETRARFGIDRNVGSDGKVTGGLTLQRFSADRLDGRNLFQAGDRVRLDLAWAFRLGASTWSTYGAGLWRERGDVTLSELDGTGEIVGDASQATGSQSLFVLGLNGSLPIATGYRVRPALDLRLQDREEEAGSGWLVGIGGDLPMRISSGLDVFPRGQLLFGTMKGITGGSHGVRGLEAGFTLRWRP